MERIVPRLEQKIELRLKLLPQFWQTIHLLQLPITQLKEKLEQEFEQNPLLDLEEESPDNIPEEEEFELEEENLWWQKKEHFTSEDAQKRIYLESLVTKPETLQEHLLRQLHIQQLPQKDYLVGEEIIGNIDEDGYFKLDSKEIASRLGVTNKRVLRLLKIIQQFDPPGIGARSLEECLIIQLRTKGCQEKVFGEIVKKFLPQLATHDYEKIEASLRISETELNKFLTILKTLDPKPGRNYAQSFPAHAIPELFLESNEQGSYKLKINERDIPRIKINKRYLQLLKDPATPAETKKYLREKLKSTKELISAMEQRNQTIEKIANFLIEHQKDFFSAGKTVLKPLRLRDVSAATGLDESTISRAVSGKYMETPAGIIELRSLFSSQVKGISSKVIKEKIKEIIANEDPQKPLSDSKVANLLKQQDIEVARRTVMKYREDMKILPASLRRREK